MTACYQCGKEIKGNAISTFPSNFHINMGDFPKSYHPSCYAKAQKEAEKELNK